MQCQVTYWDDHACPPLVMKREGRGKKASKAAPPPAMTEARRPPAPIKFTVISKERVDVEI
jgi:hypothetical protein